MLDAQCYGSCSESDPRKTFAACYECPLRRTAWMHGSLSPFIWTSLELIVDISWPIKSKAKKVLARARPQTPILSSFTQYNDVRTDVRTRHRKAATGAWKANPRVPHRVFRAWTKSTPRGSVSFFITQLKEECQDALFTQG